MGLAQFQPQLVFFFLVSKIYKILTNNNSQKKYWKIERRIDRFSARLQHIPDLAAHYQNCFPGHFSAAIFIMSWGKDVTVLVLLILTHFPTLNWLIAQFCKVDHLKMMKYWVRWNSSLQATHLDLITFTKYLRTLKWYWIWKGVMANFNYLTLLF